MFCVNLDCPDREATGEAGEYVDGVITCPVCGAELVDRLDNGEVPDLPRSASHEPPADVEAVFTTADPAEMEIAKSILSGADIPFLVEGMEKFSAFKGGQSALRFNPTAGTVVLVVPADCVEEARILLTEAAPESDGSR